MDEKKLAIVLEMLYKDAGMKEAKTALDALAESGKKTESSLNQTAMGISSLDTRVNSLYSDLQKATPQNLQYAQTFTQIQKDLASGNITIEEAKTKVGALRTEMGLADEPAKSLGQSFAGLATNLGLTAAAFAASNYLKSWAQDAILLSARVDTLGVVTETLGHNVGMTTPQIRKLEGEIQALGITTQASRQAIAQMIQAELDLANATDIARLAQDAAVISGENSSQAFEALVTVIATGNTLMARRRGLLVDFEAAYQKEAAAIGKSTDELTSYEKVQIRTNEVLDQGKNIAGAYEAAMDSAGKKLTSFPRYTEELKVAFGESFQVIFADAIDATAGLVKGLTASIKAENALKQAVIEGKISMEDSNRLINKMTWTSYEAADVMELLAEMQRVNTEETLEGIETYEDYLDSLDDLREYAEEAGMVVDELTEAQFNARKEAMDADSVLMNYANTQDLVISKTQARILLMDDEIEGWTRYGGAVEIATAKVAENAEQQAINAQNEAILQATLDGITDSYWSRVEALKALQSAMTEYSETFLGPADEKMAEDMLKTTTDYIIDTMDQVAQTGAKNANTLDFYSDLFATLSEIDPELADAMAASYKFDELLTELSSMLSADQISYDQFAAIIQQIYDDIAAGEDPIISLGAALTDLYDIQITNVLEGIESIPAQMADKFEPGLLDGLVLKLEEIKDKADDPILMIQDDGTPVLLPVLDLLHEYERTWTARLVTDTSGVVIPDLNQDYVPYPPDDELPPREDAYPVYQSAMSDPFIGSVPAGYDQHGFRPNLRTGEDYAVWKSGTPAPGGMSVSIPITVGSISSQQDIDDLVYTLVARLDELKRY